MPVCIRNSMVRGIGKGIGRGISRGIGRGIGRGITIIESPNKNL